MTNPIKMTPPPNWKDYTSIPDPKEQVRYLVECCETTDTMCQHMTQMIVGLLQAGNDLMVNLPGSEEYQRAGVLINMLTEAANSVGQQVFKEDIIE